MKSIYRTKSWAHGDTFAMKIENVDKEYDGRYIILIKCYYKKYEKDKKGNYPMFRAKITKDKVLPTTKEEIDKLEFIKTKLLDQNMRFIPYDKKRNKRISKMKIYLDEYGYLYLNIFIIAFTRKLPSSLVYLGNFDIKLPEKEYLPYREYDIKLFRLTEEFPKELVKAYKDYNLKQSIDYQKEGIEANRKTANSFLEAGKFVTNFMENMKKYKLDDTKIKLYDIDIAVEIKKRYEELYEPKIDNADLMNTIQKNCKEFLQIPYEAQVFWMVIADLQMKNNRLDEQLRQIALANIEQNRVYWILSDNYKLRLRELNKLKKRLIEYEL